MLFRSVGKEAYRGAFGERPAFGPQTRMLGDTALYVLPSTSPANAAVPYGERLRWFAALRAWIEPEHRRAVRAIVVDARDRVLLLHWQGPTGSWWITPGGGVAVGEGEAEALRRELNEEIGLRDVEPGPVVFERTHTLPRPARLVRQHERFHLVRVDRLDVAPTIDLAAEHVTGHRWCTLDELERTGERISPAGRPALVRIL